MLLSIFFIIIGFISISLEQYIRHPVRRVAHLIADSFQVNAGAAFNDKFIVNMSDDETVPESFHGVAEDIPADGLDDIFHKFRPVGFDELPFLCGTYAFIGDGFSAKLIDTDTGLDIGQSPAGGKLDEEHSAFIKEANAADFRWNALCDRSFDGSSSDRPISRAPIDFKAPTEPPYPRASSAIFPFWRRWLLIPCFSTGTPNICEADAQ